MEIAYPGLAQSDLEESRPVVTDNWSGTNALNGLTLSLPRVIRFKFLLQFTSNGALQQYEELDFS